MVKYNHCKRCKTIYDTETWIGEVHSYDGLCSSCSENEEQEENVEEILTKKSIKGENEIIESNIESKVSLEIEKEKIILSNLLKKVDGVLLGEGSIEVLIKEIKDDLIDKANYRIEKTIQSFDISKIEAQKITNFAEKKLDYMSEYKEFMDNVNNKLLNKPKMKVKAAIEKVYKESMSNMPKDVAKDILQNKKAILKIIYGKAGKWYNIYSDIEDVNELTKKMTLHPFNEIQKKLSTLPFYN